MLRAFVTAAATLFATLPASAMTLSSTDVTNGQPIASAQIYPRCGGQNISPQLSWNGAPAGTESYVVTMIDLDVKPSMWSHWIVVNIPRSATSLASGADTVRSAQPGQQPGGAATMAPPSASAATMPDGAVGIVSNFGAPFYDGPCPPPGSGTHHYKITVWAMPAPVYNSLDPNEDASEMLKKLSRASLANASITGIVVAPTAK